MASSLVVATGNGVDVFGFATEGANEVLRRVVQIFENGRTRVGNFRDRALYLQS